MDIFQRKLSPSETMLNIHPEIFSTCAPNAVLSVPLQDLEYLSEGLEGRSSNPVAVLFDTLLHPNADFGYDYPSVLQWKLEQEHYIPHIVLGKGPPGGAWHVSKSYILYALYQEECGLEFSYKRV